MEVGYLKGQSDNLPMVDHSMIVAFFSSNPNFMSAEMKNCKTERSTRESYGDNAIGYVQVKMEDNLCFVKANVTPEHRIKIKGYSVLIIINEIEARFISSECEDCAASQGGCKHATAFMFWLHRRSEEPSKTSTVCYWKKSRLSKAGTSNTLLLATELGGSKPKCRVKKNGSVLDQIVKKGIEKKLFIKENIQFFRHFEEPCEMEWLQMSSLLEKFLDEKLRCTNPVEFVKFCSKTMSAKACDEAAKATIKQGDCALWHKLKYGRITASILYDAAHCKSPDGSLVEAICGAKQFVQTKAMERGLQLENEVLKELANKLNLTIYKGGIYLDPKSPVFGVSPDGLSSKYVIEVKCPSTSKTMEKYFSGNLPSSRYMAQIQMQMHFLKKDMGIYCVASPDFEESRALKLCILNYDRPLIQNIMERALKFWSEAIFPKLIDIE